ncbi:heparan-alpha-glucosaminide N-acetyltransferase domain-containing protein [Lentisphaerota bacterium ZTH]|nr:DUF1624 domain-containing protein [Lentisphaerota bacterium]WET07567.1 heparan-alpha-glucosaminide N-acetyltransferase domain-containing protein [Lentisphaerota bacterium ZTH]
MDRLKSFMHVIFFPFKKVGATHAVYKVSDEPDLKAIPQSRFLALDTLRGLCMIVMALDHARDFFSLGYVSSSPTDLAVTTPMVFFTRWITHIAPATFVLLAGMGIFFAGRRRTRKELAILCLTRGFWLVLLDQTLIHFYWSFSYNAHYLSFSVLWAIGISMIAMAGLIYLPRKWVAVIAGIMILGHNALDGICPEAFGPFRLLWGILHVSGVQTYGEYNFNVFYPVIPWIGVMAAGYLLGRVTQFECEFRRKFFLRSGILLIIAGVIIRSINIYGDLHPWSIQKTPLYTFLSFLNVTKYPPSLVFLLFFLGISMVLLCLLDRHWGSWIKPVKIFGEVPFFFYILHLPLYHIGGMLLALACFGKANWMLGYYAPKISPEGLSYIPSLLPTYVGWICGLLIIYPLCKKFAKLKVTKRSWWISYL